MIKADHNQLYHTVISAFYRGMLAVHFRSFQVHGSIEDTGQAILMIGNHFSWWDGFIGAEVNRRCWNRRYYVMMREEELRKRKFLQKVGAFSIRPGSRSLLKSLRYASRLLEDPANLLLFFPQGGIQTAYIRTLRFQKGIGRILKSTNAHPQLIFSAAMVDYYSAVRPRLDVYLKKFEYDDEPTIATLQNAYNRFYQKAIQKQQERAK